MYKDYKILDGHVHIARQISPDALAAFLEFTGTDMASIAVVAHSRCISLVPQALMMKAMYPGRFYVYACPDPGAYFLHPDDLGEYLARYTRDMISAGCDGIKLLEGKPQMRKALPVPDFDAPVWEPFWDCCEREGVPMLWHVNDPENFWDIEHAPEVARLQGWLYDESFVNNESQYRQVMNVLKRHPKLRIIFAHFFFMSAQLERLSAILDSFPNVMIDLTPGIELYENLSADIEASRRFLRKYADRIVYGTDISGRCVLTGEHKAFDEAENLRRPVVVREFLTGEEQVILPDEHYLIGRAPFTMRPAELEKQQVQAVFYDNFVRHTGGAPRPVDAAAVLKECARLRAEMAELCAMFPGFVPDSSCVSEAERYFCEKHCRK